MKITFLTTKDTERHRSHFIIHSGMFYLAEFETMEQLKFFADTLGFSFSLVSEKPWPYNENETFRIYETDREIKDELKYFWEISDIPECAKPIKALSNGSIVTCYFINDGKTITIYRPNPNAKEVYSPLPLEQHISHTKIYGIY